MDVPFAFTERKLTEQREGDDRDYLQGAKDIHEGSLSLQQCVREVYLSAAERDEALRVISCDDGRGGMASPDAIFERIQTVLTPLIER